MGGGGGGSQLWEWRWGGPVVRGSGSGVVVVRGPLRRRYVHDSIRPIRLIYSRARPKNPTCLPGGPFRPGTSGAPPPRFA